MGTCVDLVVPGSTAPRTRDGVRASYDAPGSGHDRNLGMLAQDSYCASDSVSMTIECAGW